MNSALNPMVRPDTPGRILEGLRVDIVSQKYKPGYPLVEAEISLQYGASRGSVRTAFKALESEGLIRVLPNGRREVIGFSQKQVRDIYDLRWLLENRALEIIFEEASMHLEPMIQIFSQIEACRKLPRDEVDWYLLDIQFHRALMRMARNRPLLTAWETNMNVMHAVMYSNTIQPYERYREGFYDQHKALFTAIVTQDRSVFTALRGHLFASSQEKL